MNDDERPVVQYQFGASIDLLIAFESAAIEHLEVSNERTIVIYSRTIFNFEVLEDDLENARLVAVRVFDVSPDRSTGTEPDLDPVSLSDRLIDELATTVGVDWER